MSLSSRHCVVNLSIFPLRDEVHIFGSISSPTDAALSAAEDDQVHLYVVGPKQVLADEAELQMLQQVQQHPELMQQRCREAYDFLDAAEKALAARTKAPLPKRLDAINELVKVSRSDE